MDRHSYLVGQVMLRSSWRSLGIFPQLMHESSIHTLTLTEVGRV